MHFFDFALKTGFSKRIHQMLLILEQIKVAMACLRWELRSLIDTPINTNQFISFISHICRVCLS